MELLSLLYIFLFWGSSLCLTKRSGWRRSNVVVDLADPEDNKVSLHISSFEKQEMIIIRPKPHIRIDTITCGGTTVWKAQTPDESCLYAKIPFGDHPTHLILEYSKGRFMHTAYYENVGDGWIKSSESEFIKSLKEMTNDASILDLAAVDTGKVNRHEKDEDGVFHISYFPKNGNFSMVSDGEDVIWYGSDVCTAVYAEIRNGIIMVRLHLSHENGTEVKSYTKRGNEWFSVPHGTHEVNEVSL